jgi:hypothetical protein
VHEHGGHLGSSCILLADEEHLGNVVGERTLGLRERGEPVACEVDDPVGEVRLHLRGAQ